MCLSQAGDEDPEAGPLGRLRGDDGGGQDAVDDVHYPVGADHVGEHHLHRVTTPIVTIGTIATTPRSTAARGPPLSLRSDGGGGVGRTVAYLGVVDSHARAVVTARHAGVLALHTREGAGDHCTAPMVSHKADLPGAQVHQSGAAHQRLL